MHLGAILPSAPAAAASLEITQLDFDNRQVRPGSLFFCVRGLRTDGHEFAAAAAAAGAAALVVDHPLEDIDLPQVQVSDVRAAMAPAAARFHGDPTAELAVTGVTGTNGKTTTAYLVRALLEAAGRRTGLLGTVTSIVGGVSHGVARTTPEGIELQRTFRAMVDAGDEAAAVEVSSHALELHRVDAIHFAAAVFTNLTQDHLDFHLTMEDYFLAKRRLFAEHAPAVRVVNLDDPYGARLAAEFDTITVGLERPDATYRAIDLHTGLAGSEFTLVAPEGRLRLRSPLTGRFNVLNVLGALAAVVAQGVPLELAGEAVAAAGQVPGRFQTIDVGQAFAVLVDYAHTPDSLENVLVAARGLARGRLHVVFGCGGDRDRTKRPLMGEIAARLADHVVVTSDNPRSEDPEAIIAEILTGIDGPVEALVDRREAIARALTAAGSGDVVVLAGKGHEQGQEFADGRKLPFDDATVAREILATVPRRG
ncbi:MAG TPA: UDP-N-acetylmuramoyl-L-alanyl-D-glutamate--2,6-diaminopimelate ligase [Solirubrobacteraceae bacterium]|nr:UDP-N-acetylmuramoyl-L-alanyl-D-glutamate--2,6-diaminopimelate ligase [Solirubrobacteraceae bacterium]